MDMQVLDDALKFVRSKPEMFFPDGKPEPIHMLSWLMADLLVLGGGECTVRRRHDWWIIGSDRDWLEAPFYRLTDVELFARVVPAPNHGRNAMRAEVLVAGFFRSVWTTRDEQRKRIQGDAPLDDVWVETRGLIRTIVFSSQRVDL